MSIKNNLNILPRIRDSLSYLYVEHCRLDQDNKSIAIQDSGGSTPIPCASLSVLMMGPGTTVTHAAIRVLSDNGCTVLWSGEEGVRMYAQGLGDTRSSKNTLKQAELWANMESRMDVVRQMYQMRFPETLDNHLTIQQIRGKEGIRVKSLYATASRESGVPWFGRSYNQSRWSSGDPLNRALSSANSCMYGICHAAIISAGFSTALGFIHTGKMLSFVYDIADLYKASLAIPTAFQVVKEGTHDIERRTRKACRDAFSSYRLLQKIIPDIYFALGLSSTRTSGLSPIEEVSLGDLWDPTSESIAGGVNYSNDAMEEAA